MKALGREHEDDLSAVSKPPCLLVGVDRVALLLDVSERFVNKLRASGRFPEPIHLGGRVLWRVKDLEQWVRDGCPLIEGDL